MYPSNKVNEETVTTSRGNSEDIQHFLLFVVIMWLFITKSKVGSNRFRLRKTAVTILFTNQQTAVAVPLYGMLLLAI